MLATRLLLLLAASPAAPCGVFIDSADVQSYGEDVGSKAFQASISITRDAWKAGSTYTIDLGAAAHGPVNCWNVDQSSPPIMQGSTLRFQVGGGGGGSVGCAIYGEFSGTHGVTIDGEPCIDHPPPPPARPHLARPHWRSPG